METEFLDYEAYGTVFEMWIIIGLFQREQIICMRNQTYSSLDKF